MTHLINRKHSIITTCTLHITVCVTAKYHSTTHNVPSLLKHVDGASHLNREKRCVDPRLSVMSVSQQSVIRSLSGDDSVKDWFDVHQRFTLSIQLPAPSHLVTIICLSRRWCMDAVSQHDCL